MSNVFAAEESLINRIKDNMAQLSKVGSASSLAGYQEIPTDSAFILPGGMQVIDGKDDEYQIEMQYWTVLICVAHQEDVLTNDYDTTAKRAGELLYQVQELLIGWKPLNNYRPMKLVNRPEPDYLPGYAEFPALFETGLVLAGI